MTEIVPGVNDVATWFTAPAGTDVDAVEHGAWLQYLERIAGNWVTMEMFGGVADGDAGGGWTDNATAWLAFKAAVEAGAIGLIGAPGTGYYFGSRINWPLNGKVIQHPDSMLWLDPDLSYRAGIEPEDYSSAGRSSVVWDNLRVTAQAGVDGKVALINSGGAIIRNATVAGNFGWAFTVHGSGGIFDMKSITTPDVSGADGFHVVGGSLFDITVRGADVGDDVVGLFPAAQDGGGNIPTDLVQQSISDCTVRIVSGRSRSARVLGLGIPTTTDFQNSPATVKDIRVPVCNGASDDIHGISVLMNATANNLNVDRIHIGDADITMSLRDPDPSYIVNLGNLHYNGDMGLVTIDRLAGFGGTSGIANVSAGHLRINQLDGNYSTLIPGSLHFRGGTVGPCRVDVLGGNPVLGNGPFASIAPTVSYANCSEWQIKNMNLALNSDRAFVDIGYGIRPTIEGNKVGPKSGATNTSGVIGTTNANGWRVLDNYLSALTTPLDLALAETGPCFVRGNAGDLTTYAAAFTPVASPTTTKSYTVASAGRSVTLYPAMTAGSISAITVNGQTAPLGFPIGCRHNDVVVFTFSGGDLSCLQANHP